MVLVAGGDGRELTEATAARGGASANARGDRAADRPGGCPKRREAPSPKLFPKGGGPGGGFDPIRSELWKTPRLGADLIQFDPIRAPMSTYEHL